MGQRRKKISSFSKKAAGPDSNLTLALISLYAIIHKRSIIDDRKRATGQHILSKSKFQSCDINDLKVLNICIIMNDKGKRY